MDSYDTSWKLPPWAGMAAAPYGAPTGCGKERDEGTVMREAESPICVSAPCHQERYFLKGNVFARKRKAMPFAQFFLG